LPSGGLLILRAPPDSNALLTKPNGKKEKLIKKTNCEEKACSQGIKALA
jgi:hypothetical protein